MFQKISTTQKLKSNSDTQDAKKLLESVAAMVCPIMKNRNWLIKELSEFYPRNPNLLGLNINRKFIKIRLRRADDVTKFLEFEDILGTLLHELVHIVISPHNTEFYSMLDTLWNELDNSIMTTSSTYRSSSNSYNNSTNKFVPFSGEGNRLCSSGSNIGACSSSSASIRRLAVMAALDRQRNNQSRDNVICSTRIIAEIDLTTEDDNDNDDMLADDDDVITVHVIRKSS